MEFQSTAAEILHQYVLAHLYQIVVWFLGPHLPTTTTVINWEKIKNKKYIVIYVLSEEI